MQFNKGEESKQDVEGFGSTVERGTEPPAAALLPGNRSDDGTKSRRKFFNPPVVFKGLVQNVKPVGGAVQAQP